MITALEIDVVADQLVGRQHHAAEFHFANAERPAFAQAAEPDEEESRPTATSASTPRQPGINRIGHGNGIEKPQIGMHTSNSAVISPLSWLPPRSEMWVMRSNISMGGSGKRALPWAEKLALSAGQEAGQVKTGPARGILLVHFVLILQHLTEVSPDKIPLRHFYVRNILTAGCTIPIKDEARMTVMQGFEMRVFSRITSSHA